MQSKEGRWFGQKVAETTAEEGFKSKNQDTVKKEDQDEKKSNQHDF
jgi:hypothetical protein